jgi:hypothetical protein
MVPFKAVHKEFEHTLMETTIVELHLGSSGRERFSPAFPL